MCLAKTPAPVRWGGGKCATGRTHMPGSITVVVGNSPCHGRNDGDVTARWVGLGRRPTERRARHREALGPFHRVASITCRPGSLGRPFYRFHLHQPIGLIMLPGGTPANLRWWRSSAACASRWPGGQGHAGVWAAPGIQWPNCLGLRLAGLGDHHHELRARVTGDG